MSGNFVPPILLSGFSGYSEVANGKADLISTYYANWIFNTMNVTDTHAAKVAEFLDSLTLPTGGIMTTATSSNNVGYTVTGLRLYRILRDQYNISLGPDFPVRSEN